MPRFILRFFLLGCRAQVDLFSHQLLVYDPLSFLGGLVSHSANRKGIRHHR
jgi:hypothetical protein